jgi:hypothetical protein
MRKIFFCCLFLINIITIGTAQSDYKVIKVKLPMSTTEKEYYVKKVGIHYVLNGDIIVGNAGQSLMMYQSNDKDGYIWPKGAVPVVIDNSMRENKTTDGVILYQNAMQAIKELNAKTNLRLVPHTNQKDYIRIVYSADTTYGGLSPIGRKGGEQIIYITRSSNVKTVMHELLHSLGFWHEQSRYDRDNYITIDMTNVPPDQRHNFQIEPGSPTSPYDYKSIMHYHAFAFALDKTKTTIRCKNTSSASGQVCDLGGNELTIQDIAGINTSYFYNADIAKVDYKALVEFYKNIPMAKKVQGQPGMIDESSKATKIKDVPVADGIYMIKDITTLRYVTVANASNDNGALAQLSDKAGGENQKFAVTRVGDGVYLLRAMHSGKYLNVTGQSEAADATINQWDYVDQPNLKFYLRYNHRTKAYNIQGFQSNLYWFRYNNINGENIVQAARVTDYFVFERVGNIPLPKMEGANIKTANPSPKLQVIKKGGN